MSLSRQLGILIVSALLALLLFAPSEARVRAGSGVPPPNDDFADATVIEALPYRDTVDTTRTPKCFDKLIPPPPSPNASPTANRPISSGARIAPPR